MKKNSNLLLFAGVILLIAIANTVMLIVDFCTGNYAMITHQDKVVENVTNVLMIVLVSISVLSILINIGLGIKGIGEAVNPKGGKAHIFIAKFIAIVNLIMALIVAVSLFNTNDLSGDIGTLFICMIDSIIMYSYAQECEKVNKSLK